MATLTVYLPSQIQSVTFTNGTTASNRQGVGYVNYTSGIKISSVVLGAGYSTWSGTLYWNNGTTDFAFGTVSNGSVSIYSSSSQEQIDYTGNRSITVKAVASTSYTLTCYFDSTLQSVTFTNGTTASNRQGVGYVNYSSAVKISSAILGAGYSTWSGTLYWENAAGTSYEFGYVVDGVVYIRGDAVQEPISYTGNRSITIYGVGSFAYLYNVHAFGNGGLTNVGESSIYWPTSGYFKADDSVFNFPLSRIQQFTRTGYRFLGWAYGANPSAGETYYTDAIQLSASVSGTTNNIHAVWGEQISPFYWFGNETTDANNIQSGKTRTMTATMWDSFADTVDMLASICGVTVSISRPSSGSRMNASQYNTAVTALTTIKNSRTSFRNVTLPSAVSSGSSITAAQFQGTGSIKGALNAMIALL